MKKSLLIISAVFCWQMLLPVRSGFCASLCEAECDPQVMKNMVEGKIAQMNCLQACRQRKVWEQMVLAIDRLTIQFAEQAKNKNSQGEVEATGTSMQKVNFEEAEPHIYRSDEKSSSFQFGSVTRVNPTYTNATLVSPTIVDAVFKNSTE